MIKNCAAAASRRIAGEGAVDKSGVGGLIEDGTATVECSVAGEGTICDQRAGGGDVLDRAAIVC